MEPGKPVKVRQLIYLNCDRLFRSDQAPNLKKTYMRNRKNTQCCQPAQLIPQPVNPEIQMDCQQVRASIFWEKFLKKLEEKKQTNSNNH